METKLDLKYNQVGQNIQKPNKFLLIHSKLIKTDYNFLKITSKTTLN